MIWEAADEASAGLRCERDFRHEQQCGFACGDDALDEADVDFCFT